MSVLRIMDDFYKALLTNDVTRSGPVQKIDEAIFCQLLEPIYDLMVRDPLYLDIDIDLHAQVSELRRMCQEVQTRHDTDDYILKLGRNELLNVLQNILENAEEAKGGAVVMEVDDLFTLSNLTDVIRGDARIYREFLKSPSIADALCKVADNIDKAQSRLWSSAIKANVDISGISSNDIVR